MKRITIHIASACLCIGANNAAFAEQEVHEIYSGNTTETALSLKADTSKVRNLDEIVVIAQPKESTTLRNMPIASSVFTHKELSRLGVKSLSDLSAYIPALDIPQYGSRLTSSVYIRGIGSRVNNPAVGVYIDGMPLLSKNAYNTHIYQTDRIDVLRGPQGTLYGMNTEGGLIRMFTKSPLSHKGTDVKLALGNHFLRNAEITKYISLSDRFAVALSGFYNGYNGFLSNATTGKRADAYNEGGGRLRIAKQQNARLTYDFSTDYQYVNQNGFAYGQYDNSTGSMAAPANNRYNGYKRNMWNSVLNINYVRPSLTFNSTTSYQFLSDRMKMDQDYTNLDYMHLQQKQLQNGITQEFSIKSQTSRLWKHTSGVFFSYLWQRTEAPVYFDADFNTGIASTIQTAMYGAISSAMAEKFKATPGITDEMAMEMARKTIERAGGISVSDISMSVPGLFHTPQLNLGIYHESLLDITDRLTFNIGLRYDLSRVKIAYATNAAMNASVSVMGKEATSTISSILNNSKSDVFNQILPKIGVTWRFDENGSNLYASICKGYRAGGYNIQMFSDILQAELRTNSTAALRNGTGIEHTEEDYNRVNSTISYKPELSWNYEIGTHLNLFDNKVQADIAAFYIKIRNQQLSVMAGNYGFGRMMVNAGRSHSLGAELSVRGKAFDNRLTWNTTYSFTHSVFDNYTEEKGNTVIDHSGRKVPFIPRHTLGLAADWTFPIAGKSLNAIVLGANVKALGKTYWDETNQCAQKFYAIPGAHLDARFKNVDISLWAKNFTATRYATFAFSSSATGKEIWLAQRGMPFQLGVEANIHF